MIRQLLQKIEDGFEWVMDRPGLAILSVTLGAVILFASLSYGMTARKQAYLDNMVGKPLSYAITEMGPPSTSTNLPDLGVEVKTWDTYSPESSTYVSTGQNSGTVVTTPATVNRVVATVKDGIIISIK